MDVFKQRADLLGPNESVIEASVLKRFQCTLIQSVQNPTLKKQNLYKTSSHIHINCR